MTNFYLELREIEKEIGFDELQRNVLEQKEIALIFLLNSYIDLKFKVSLMSTQTLFDILFKEGSKQ